MGAATIRKLGPRGAGRRSEEHTSELQSHSDLVCRLLLEKKKKQQVPNTIEGHLKLAIASRWVTLGHNRRTGRLACSIGDGADAKCNWVPNHNSSGGQLTH